MAEDIVDITVTNYNDSVTVDVQPNIIVVNISNLNGLTGIIIPSGAVGRVPYYDTATTLADSPIYTDGYSIGINNTTPTFYSTNKGLVVRNGSGNVELILQHDGNTAASIQGLSISNVKTDAAYIFNRENLPLKFGTNDLYRGQFNAAGYLKVSPDGSFAIPTGSQHEIRQPATNSNIAFLTNSSASPYGPYINFTATPNNGTNYFLDCADGTASRFTVKSNGGLANYQANDTNLSDIRTKDNIHPLESYWNKIKAIEIVKFKYKDQTHADYNIGVIAQQVEAVAPEFVDIDGWEGEEVEVGQEPLKSIYSTDLYHASIKALQEAMQRIEALEALINN